MPRQVFPVVLPLYRDRDSSLYCLEILDLDLIEEVVDERMDLVDQKHLLRG